MVMISLSASPASGPRFLAGWASWFSSRACQCGLKAWQKSSNWQKSSTSRSNIDTSPPLMVPTQEEECRGDKGLASPQTRNSGYHQTDERIEAHILVAFVTYCLQVTLKQRLRSRAPGLTPRSVLDKMAAIQMVDVHLPTTDGRTVILSRYTEPEPDQALLLQMLKLGLPGQPPPRIMSDGTPIPQ